MADENKIAAAIMTAAVVNRSSGEGANERDVYATMAKHYSNFLMIIEWTEIGKHRSDEQWKDWIKTVLG